MGNLRATLSRHGSIHKLSNVWRRAKWFAASTVASATLIATPLFATMTAHAQSDVTPPLLTNATLVTTQTQDISTPSGAYIIVNADITEDLSGMDGASQLVYTSPTGNQTASGSLQQRVGSTAPDQYEFDVQVPQYSEIGLWKPTLTLVDASGNKAVWTDADLIASGWDLETTLTGTADTAGPVLANAQLTSPSTLDSSAQSVAFVSVNATDDLSGFSGQSNITYTSPSGSQVSGPAQFNYDGSGILTTNATFLQNAESGVWTPVITLIDAVGNKSTYTNSDLLARGIDLRVTLSGPSDTSAPTLSKLAFGLANPIVDSVPYGGAIVSVNGTFNDNSSGVGNAQIQYTSAGGQTATGQFQQQPDGTYTATIQLPPYSQSGMWEPDVTITDNAGNVASFNSATLASMGDDVSFGITKNITSSTTPGGTVTSDTEGDGATTADPVEAWVTTPTGGDVSIVIVSGSTITDQTNGYQFFGRQLSISAPQESVDNPLTLTFQIDSSVIPAGQDENTLQVTRNGSVIPACTDNSTANPDPCVFSRQRLSDGDISIGIHSTTASVWGSGFPATSTPAPSKYHFSGFEAPVQKTGLTEASAGSVVPLRFNLGGKFGTKILAPGSPTVQQINCTTLAATGTVSSASSVANTGLLYVVGKYTYAWQTNKKWKNTCLQISFKLDDGTTFSAPFKF